MTYAARPYREWSPPVRADAIARWRGWMKRVSAHKHPAQVGQPIVAAASSESPFTPLKNLSSPPKSIASRFSSVLSLYPSAIFQSRTGFVPIDRRSLRRCNPGLCSVSTFTNGRLCRRTHPTVPAICRGHSTGRSALHLLKHRETERTKNTKRTQRPTLLDTLRRCRYL